MYQRCNEARCLLILKANNKYIKDCHRNEEFSYFNYWDVNNLNGWVMPQKLTKDDFKLLENRYQFNEYFIEKCNEDSDEGYFDEVDD